MSSSGGDHDHSNDPNIIYGGPLQLDFDRGCRSLGELILKEFSKRLEKVALINGVTSVQLSYGGILEQSLALASYLREMGIAPNDVVAIISENRFEYPVTVFALMYLGTTAALFNPGYSVNELEHCLKLTKPKVVIVSAQPYLALQKAVKNIKLASKIIHFDSSDHELTFQKCLENSNRQLELGKFVPNAVDIANQVALIVMSSGTTGLPKGVQITQSNMMTTFSYTRTFLDKIGSTTEDMISVEVTPWFHVAGGVTMLNWLINGMRLVFLPKYHPRSYLRCIQQYRPNMLNLVPPIAVFLAKNPMVDHYDLSSVKTIISGAAPLSREVEDLIRSRLKITSIRQAYGLSETTLAILVQMDAENKPGSVGRVRPGQWVKVVDPDTGRTLGPYQRGELCFKGTLIMKGYLGLKDAVDKNGWFRTGDVGYYDDEKDFYIVDRLKELIKYNAYQVPPAELEAILLSHPKVKDAAVIGVPDERVGELATAFVVSAEGASVDPLEIVKFVDGQVSEQKRLHGGVRLIDEIPKTASGKILRRTLREIAKRKSKL
ncbi:luciferin 4-monooxygenase-like [Uranotaenia lowii]|uniref:luciferin 4-monooxygenase-like n=1 Tax=Uranotaenia lowii TaxID=190385 RepID=UPI002479EADF|nr:luciferin 4-monooxygenase-like [Uranotaenia lowii]